MVEFKSQVVRGLRKMKSRINNGAGFKKLSFFQNGVWVLKGFALGLSGLVPGLSAGTVALILGVYEKVIYALPFYRRGKHNTRPPASHSLEKAQVSYGGLEDSSWVFWLCLTGGAGAAVFLGSNLINWCLSVFPLELYSFFIGLIMASVPKIFYFTDRGKRSVFWMVVMTLSVWVGGYFFPENLKWDLLTVGAWDPLLFWGVLFVSGFLAAFASVLPGLSGSMILVILGTYPVVLKFLTELDLWTCMVFIIGGGASLCGVFFVQVFFKKQSVLCFLLKMMCWAVLGLCSLPLGPMGVFLLTGGAGGVLTSCLLAGRLLNRNKNMFFCIALALILGSLPFVFPYGVWQADPTGGAALRVVIFTCVGAGVFFLLETLSLPFKRDWDKEEALSVT